MSVRRIQEEQRVGAVKKRRSLQAKSPAKAAAHGGNNQQRAGVNQSSQVGATPARTVSRFQTLEEQRSKSTTKRPFDSLRSCNYSAKEDQRTPNEAKPGAGSNPHALGDDHQDKAELSRHLYYSSAKAAECDHQLDRQSMSNGSFLPLINLSKSLSDQSCLKEGGGEQASPSPKKRSDHSQFERSRDNRQQEDKVQLNNDLNEELQGDLMQESEQDWGLQVPASATEIDPRSSSAHSAKSVRQGTSDSLRSKNSRNQTSKPRKGPGQEKTNSSHKYSQVLSATEKNIDKRPLQYNDPNDNSSLRQDAELQTGKQNSVLSHHKTESKTIVHSNAEEKVAPAKPQKPAGGLNFNFVSVSPSKKQMVDRNLIKHFKQIQEGELTTWKGINVKFTLRPGMSDSAGQSVAINSSSTGAGSLQSTNNGSNVQFSSFALSSTGGGPILNAMNNIGGSGASGGISANGQALKRSSPCVAQINFFEEQKQYLKIEEKRFKCLLDLMLKYREWEEERIKMQLMQGASSGPGGGASAGQASGYGNQRGDDHDGYGGADARSANMPNMEHYGVSTPQQQTQNIQNNLKTEFVNFRPLKDSSILIRDGQSTLYFQKGAILNQHISDSSNEMYFKLVKCEAKLLRAVLENNGFQQTETHDWNLLWSSQSYKPYIYDNMNEYQKINHFPNSFELTRKDRLCTNIVKMQEKFGKDVFNIIPDTYNLPDEFADFYSHFHQLRQQQDNSQQKDRLNQWIIKPINSSQGKGIFIIDDISEVPIDEPYIVSRYIHNPLLINGLKFDVRIYVLITSMDPWRIYVYNEGLARFASDEYDAHNIKSNKYAHLTNYSINKKNEKFVQNSNAEQGDEGHKWSLTALSKHLEHMGVDLELLWSKIYDIIIKSLLAVDGSIQSQLKKMNTKGNCFELLGFDVMIDSDLKPWLLEVNLSPSLACDSPIDLKIKHSLFVDTINLACLKKFDRRRENLNKMKQRAKNIVRAKSYQSRQNIGASGAVQNQKYNQYMHDKNQSQSTSQQYAGGQNTQQNNVSLCNAHILDKLQKTQQKFKDALRETLQENFRRGGFLRIYPSKNSNIYDKFLNYHQPTNQGGGPSTSSFGQNQSSQNQITGTSSGTVPASRVSNKILHRLLYSDELAAYPNGSLIRKFSKTFSKYQILSQMTQASDSIAGAQDKSSAPSVMAVREGQSSNQSINGGGGAVADFEDQHADQGSALKDASALGSGQASSQSASQGAKKSFHKFNRATNMMAQSSSAVQKPGGSASGIGNNASGSLGKQAQNLSSLTPQKQFMGKRGDRGGAGTGIAQVLETQGKQQLLPALNQNQQSQQAMSSAQQQPSSVVGMRGKGQHAQSNGAGQGSTSSAIQGSSSGVTQSSTGTIKKDKLLITGDDILIEYVARLMIAVKSIKENMLKAQWIYQIEKFIKHSVWHSSDVRRAHNNKLWQRLESRLIEMKERRKRLLQSLYNKELKSLLDGQGSGFSANRQAQQAELEQFQKEYKFREEQKNVIIQGFSAQQLEEMLHTSTKNVAYEVISCLIQIDNSSSSGPGVAEKSYLNGSKGASSSMQATKATCKGVLTDIIKWLTMTNQQQMLHDVEFSILDQISTKQNRQEGSAKKYGAISSTGVHHSSQKNKKNLASLNRSTAGGGSSIKSTVHDNGSHNTYHTNINIQAEDETESYQVQFGGDYSLSNKKLRIKVQNQQQLQSFAQHGAGGGEALGSITTTSNQQIEGISKFDLDSRTNSASEPFNAVAFSNRKRNLVGSIQGASAGGVGSGLGVNAHNQIRSSDPKDRGFPTPSRHQVAASVVGPADAENCDRSVTSAKSNDNAKSATYTGGANASGGAASFSGVGADRPSGSGIKSLQGTAKKNRIIINDDLRSQHKMQYQMAQQQAHQDSRARGEKPVSRGRQHHRGGLHQGRQADAVEAPGTLHSPKSGAGSDSQMRLRSFANAQRHEESHSKKQSEPFSADSFGSRSKALNVVVSELSNPLNK